MNKKGIGIGLGEIATIIFIGVAVAVLVIIALIIIPPAWEKMEDFANRYLGWGEKEQEIEPGAIPEEYMLAFQGIYETFLAGMDTEDERCLLEYPEMTNLGKNAIAFEKEGKKLKMLFIDDQGKELQIEGFGPIPDLEPCFVAGTKDGKIVAQNFYENWWVEGVSGKEPEYINGSVKMYNRGGILRKSAVPDTLEVIKSEDVKKGTIYNLVFNPTFLYKADEKHICFMPEHHGRIRIRDICSGAKDGLVYVCFKEIKNKVKVCEIGGGGGGGGGGGAG